MDDPSDTDIGRRALLRSGVALGTLGTVSSTTTAAGQAPADDDRVVVEDFEDGDLSEYVADSDHDDGTAFGTFEVADGSLAGSGGSLLRATQGNRSGNNPSIYSTEGLDYYPSRGDVVEFYTRYDHGNHTPEFYFGVQGEDEHYTVEYDSREDLNPHDPNTLSLDLHHDDGTETLARADAPFSDHVGEVLRFRVSWGRTIEVTAYDASDEVVATVSAEDDTYDEGGIGFKLRGHYWNDDTAEWDRVTAIPGAVGDGVVVEQGGETYEVEALHNGAQQIEDFYDYGSVRSSADTPTNVESGAQSSKLFVYDGPEGPSLGLVHDHHGYPGSTSSGGRAVFEFDGLEGSWVVEDDPGDWTRSSSSPPERIDWQWNDRNTDGGAFRFDEETFSVTVTPDFRDGIDEWMLLTGVDDEGTGEIATELDPSEPVTIRRGGEVVGKERPSDAAIDSRAGHGGDLRFEYGERGARSMRVDGTETLFHEFFALETSTGEVVTSYDEDAVTVTEPFEAVNPGPAPGQVTTLEVEIGGTTVEVQREVTVDLVEPRVTVDYQLEMAEEQSSLGLTLYTAADFDVGGPAGDVGAYHGEGDFLFVEDASDDVPLVAGLAGDIEPDGHDLREYPAYAAVESGDRNDADEFPGGDGAGDAVATLAFDLGLLKSGDQGYPRGSTRRSRSIRLGAAETVEELQDVLDRRLDLTLHQPRLAQSVEGTRLVDSEPPDETTLRTIDDPPLVEGKSTVPLFDLEVQNLSTFESSSDVELAVTTLAESGSHPGRTVVDRYEATLPFGDVATLSRNPRDTTALEESVPSFEYEAGVTAIRIELSSGDDRVNGDSYTLEVGEDFETESMDPLRIGFALLEGPNDGDLVDDNASGPQDDPWQEFESDYESLVRDAVSLIEQTFPVPEVRAYRHDDILDGNDSAGDDSVLQDGIRAKEELIDETPIPSGDTLRGTGRVEAFDATLLIVPEGYFDFHTPDDWSGLHKHDPDAAALAEVGVDDETVAHEIGHHFSGDLYAENDREYPHELAQRDDKGVDTSVEQRDGTTADVEFSHARFPESDLDDSTSTDDPGLVCTRVGVDDDTLANVDVDTHPLMSYGDDRWMDTLQYYDMIAQELEPHPRGAGADAGGEPVDRAAEVVLSDVSESYARVDVTTDRPTKVHGAGDVTVEVLDGDQSLLSTHQVQDYTGVDAEGPGGEVLSAAQVRVPFPEDAVYLRTTRNGETETTNVLAESLRSAVEALPDEAFDGPAQRRRALLNKLDAVARQIDSGAYRGAANKLRNDVRKHLAQWVRDDWAGSLQASSRDELLELAEDRAEDVAAMADAGESGRGGGRGRSGGRGKDSGRGGDRGNDDSRGGGRGTGSDRGQ